MGFGFASLIAGPLMQILVAKYGLVQNFIILGCVYMVIMAASALYLEPPKASNGGPSGINVKSILPDTQFTTKEARKTWQFYALWWIFSPILPAVSDFSSSFTDGTGSSKNDTDGSRLHGRYHRSDQRSRPHFLVYYFRLSRAQHGLCSLFLIQIFAFYALAETSSVFVFQLIVFVIISCYGGGFSCMPAFLSDLFGTKELSAIHGKILTAWGMAGIAGPLLLSWIRETTNSYSITLYFFSACFVVSLIIAGILKWRTSVGVLIEKKHI